jgi:hypothetical protein
LKLNIKFYILKERVFNNQKQMELPVPDLYFHRQETRQESYMGKGIVVREDSEMFMNINLYSPAMIGNQFATI